MSKTIDRLQAQPKIQFGTGRYRYKLASYVLLGEQAEKTLGCRHIGHIPGTLRNWVEIDIGKEGMFNQDIWWGYLMMREDQKVGLPHDARRPEEAATA